MVTVSLLDRTRTRDRARPRPNAPGNYITAAFFASVFSLTFTPSPENYIKWWPYVFPETKAIGYVDDPPISPPWVAVGPVATVAGVPNIAGSIIPGVGPTPPAPPSVPFPQLPAPALPSFEVPTPTTPAAIALPPVSPTSVAPGSNPVVETGTKGGDTGTFIPGTSPRQLFTGTFPIRTVTILAPSSNAADIHLGFSPEVTTEDSFPLAPGAAKDFKISDLSNLYILGENATDQIRFSYEV